MDPATPYVATREPMPERMGGNEHQATRERMSVDIARRLDAEMLAAAGGIRIARAPRARHDRWARRLKFAGGCLLFGAVIFGTPWFIWFIGGDGR